MIPIEIVNKILIYVSEINNNIITIQYDLVTNKKYYKINFYSNLLWKIKSTLIMKQIYPIYSCDFSKKENIELYQFGIPHYEKKLRENIIK
jgi:hypothetical protein